MTAPTSAVVQQRNAEMTALASADLLAADDKNVATEVTPSAPTSFGLNSNTVVPFGIQYTTSFPEVFNLDLVTGKLEILEYGLYHFYGGFGIQHTGGGANSNTIQGWIEEETAPSTFFILPMSQTFFATSPHTGVKASGSFSFTRFSQPGYKYRMKIQQAYGGSDPYTTIANQCKLGVIRLFKQG